MNRSDSSSMASSATSSVSSRETYINPNSPYVIAAEHHKHGCCNQRYHCDGSKCPTGMVFNPAIGIPLAICTGGLSAAACGIYRGVRDHKYRKEMKKAYTQAMQQPQPPTELVSPSNIAAPPREKGPTPSTVPGVVEMDAGSSIMQPSGVSEKMDDTTPPMSKPPNLPEKMDDRETGLPRMSEKMDDRHDDLPSELDSASADGTLPRYSELESPR